MSWFSTSLRDLPKLRSSTKRRRVSSHDPTHGNKDFLEIKRGTKKVIADIQGSGCVTHFWVTMESPDRNYIRKVILRVYWDNEENPSIG